MTLAREALLVGGGDELAVAQQRGRRVVVEGGDPEDVHRPSLEESLRAFEIGRRVESASRQAEPALRSRACAAGRHARRA